MKCEKKETVSDREADWTRDCYSKGTTREKLREGEGELRARRVTVKERERGRGVCLKIPGGKTQEQI